MEGLIATLLQAAPGQRFRSGGREPEEATDSTAFRSPSKIANALAAADAFAVAVAGQYCDQATIGALAHLGGPAMGLAVQAGLVAGVDQPRIGQVGVLAAEPGVVTRRGLEQHQGRRRRRRALREVWCPGLVRRARARSGGRAVASHAGDWPA